MPAAERAGPAWRRVGPSTIELRLAAASLEEALADTALAVARLLDGDEGEPERLPVFVPPGDPSQLLAGFADDLFYLAAVEAFAVGRLERVDLRDGAVRAAATGRRGTRQPLRLQVRRASLSQAGGRWTGVLLAASTERRREARGAPFDEARGTPFDEGRGTPLDEDS